MTIKQEQIEKISIFNFKMFGYVSNIFQWLSTIKPKLKDGTFYALKAYKDGPKLDPKSVKLGLYKIHKKGDKESKFNIKCDAFVYNKGQRTIESV